MNMTIPSLTDDDRALLNAYEADVCGLYGPAFASAGSRLVGGDRLLARFQDAMTAVRRHGRRKFRGAFEAHNELSAASALLEQEQANKIEYEPPLPGTNQTVDFVVTGTTGQKAYLDVKTIRPERKDRWEQFEMVREAERITPNVSVGLSRTWMGGELWHDMYAARGRMLEYTREFEAKLRAASLGAGVPATMMFCGEGATWERDHLEDFVAFYQTGVHRQDDPLAKMEAKYIADNAIVLDRSIGAFASLRRDEFEMRSERICWDVRPPLDGL